MSHMLIIIPVAETPKDDAGKIATLNAEIAKLKADGIEFINLVTKEGEGRVVGGGRGG
jgi:hypothetical protein